MAEESTGKSAKDKSAKKKRHKKSAAAAPPPAAPAGGVPIVPVVIALAAGLGGGWVLRDSQQPAATEVKADPATTAAPSASAAPGKTDACAAWTAAVCKEAGETSEACEGSKAAASVMPAGACAAAKNDVAGTLARAKQARSACDQLVKKLCADLGDTTQTCKMVKEKTPQFPAARCRDMLDGYAGVLKELKDIEKQNAPLSKEVAAKQRAGDGPGFGPVDAKVAVVEYSDFECPYCSLAAENVNKLKKRYAKVVRFVFRQFPLPMHQNAPLAHEAALEAHAQGKFWALHDKMFANQRALDRASLEGYAKEAGLDMAKFKKALDERTHKAAVDADMKLGGEIGVQGTPTMVVGTERVQNPTDYASVSALIDKQLKAAGVEPPAAE